MLRGGRALARWRPRGGGVMAGRSGRAGWMAALLSLLVGAAAAEPARAGTLLPAPQVCAGGGGNEAQGNPEAEVR